MLYHLSVKYSKLKLDKELFLIPLVFIIYEESKVKATARQGVLLKQYDNSRINNSRDMDSL